MEPELRDGSGTDLLATPQRTSTASISDIVCRTFLEEFIIDS